MKRICSVLLCLALLSPPALAASEGSWPAWAEPALSWGQDKSIGSEFLSAPAAVVTRGAAAQLLYEAAGRPDVSAACPFSDVSGAYADAVTWRRSGGISPAPEMGPTSPPAWSPARSSPPSSGGRPAPPGRPHRI